MSKICIGLLEHDLSQVHIAFKNSGGPSKNEEPPKKKQRVVEKTIN